MSHVARFDMNTNVGYIGVYMTFRFLNVYIGNTGNLPLVLVPGICKEESSPFGESDTCSQNGVAYVSYGLWVSHHGARCNGRLEFI